MKRAMLFLAPVVLVGLVYACVASPESKAVSTQEKSEILTEGTVVYVHMNGKENQPWGFEDPSGLKDVKEIRTSDGWVRLDRGQQGVFLLPEDQIRWIGIVKKQK